MGWFGQGFVLATLSQVPEENIRAESAFLYKALRLGPSIRVLDAGCGLGRHAVVLAECGCVPVGVESDEYTFQTARARLPESARKRVEFRHEVVGKDWTGGTFDCGYSLMSPLGFGAEPDDDRHFLTAIRRALVTGGRFVLDYVNLTSLLGSLTDWGIMTCPDGRRIVSVRGFDPLSARSTRSRVLLSPSGLEMRVDHVEVRLSYPHEVLALLRETGFECLAVFGDFAGRPYTMESPRLIVVCRAC